MPLVSIITPVYNSENYLHFCVDSILSQSYNDIELILINDGSKDRSGEICDNYAKLDKRVRVIHKKNEGVSAARNTGIYSAKGKYILFVDSDDLIRENYVSEFLKAKEKYPDCKNIWCAFVVKNSYKDAVASPYKENGDAVNNTEKYIELKRDRMASLAEKWLTQMLWNKLYLRDVIVNNSLKMDEDMSLGEDIVFGLEYLDKTEDDNIVLINTPLYIYMRTGKESLDNMYHKNRVELSYKMNNALEYHYKKWDLPKSEMTKLYNAVFFRLENTMTSVMSKKNSAGFLSKIKECKKILRSEQFSSAFKNCDCNIHVFYKVCYRLRIYLPVHLMNKYLKKRKNRQKNKKQKG